MTGNVYSSVLQILLHYLPKQISPALVTKDADLQNDLGFDSLGLATLATDLRDTVEFDLEYFADNLGEIRQVSDLVRIVEEALLVTDH